VVFVVVSGASAAAPPGASALNLLKPVCKVTGFASKLFGTACSVVESPGRLVTAGKKLLGGHPGQALKSVLGDAAPSASQVTRALGLAAVVTWALGGARAALQETAGVLNHSTSPQLRSTWFSSTYWRMAGISAVLTLPFLFAAAVQAVIRSDLTLLLRAAFGYLPLAMLSVSIAAPLTMLLLAAADELSAIVASAAGNASGSFLTLAAQKIGVLTAVGGSPFLAFVLGVFTVAGALALWIELVMREAAVYVIVLMLPLAFAALVWPARRVWATRAVEVLIALILSKFAIVAVLSLGGAALSASLGQHSISSLIAGLVLLVMGAFTPWALLRMLPLTELAAGAAGSLHHEGVRAMARPAYEALRSGDRGDDWATSTTAQMRRDAEATRPQRPPRPDPSDDDAVGLESADTMEMGAEVDPARGDESGDAAAAGAFTSSRQSAGSPANGTPTGNTSAPVVTTRLDAPFSLIEAAEGKTTTALRPLADVDADAAGGSDATPVPAASSPPEPALPPEPADPPHDDADTRPGQQEPERGRL
jgi:hypothetical protein